MGRNIRLSWIDFAKVVGIWFVILGHTGLPAEYMVFIYSFHMPLFFFISGYLEKRRTLQEAFRHSLTTLIVPYFLFSIIFYCYWLFVAYLRHPNLYGPANFQNGFIKPFLGMLMGVGYNTSASTMLDPPLWFLISLFIVKLLHSILIKSVKNNLLWYLFANILVVVLVYLINNNYIFVKYTSLFSFHSSLMALPFFSAGFLCKRIDLFNMHGAPINFSPQLVIRKIANRKLLKVIVVVILLFALYEGALLNARVDINLFLYGRNILLFYINGFIGTALIILISTYYKRNYPFIITLSAGMILMIGIQTIFIFAFKTIFEKFHLPLSVLPQNIIIATIILVMMWIPIKLSQRYFSVLLGRRKIGGS